MQRRIVNIPPNFARVISCNWDIDWRGQGSGDANDGASRVIYNAFPRWIGAPQVFLVGDQIAQWRAIKLHAQGRVGVYRMQMIDPAGFGFFADVADPVPFAGGELFSGGVGFAHRPTALAVGPVAAGAEELRIDVAPSGFAPVAGQLMSEGDWPFSVTWVRLVSGTVYDIGVQMPIRQAILDGASIDLIATGLFEAQEDLMGQSEYTAVQHATVSLSFREVLSR